MSEQFYRIDSNVPISEAQWNALQEFKRIGVLVPVEVDQGFISRAIIAELDRRCMGDVPPGRHEWARDHFDNVLTDDEGLPRMCIFEISDVVLAALGIGGDACSVRAWAERKGIPMESLRNPAADVPDNPWIGGDDA